MAREQLSPILDRGWEALPVVRRVLSSIAADQFDTVSVADLGNRLLKLAEEFEQCGQPIPARQVLSLSEAFTELAQPDLAPSSELMGLLRTTLNHWEDLLVELDAVGRITQTVPLDTTIRLDSLTASRRMDRQSLRSIPANDFKIGPEKLSELRSCGESLFDASSSLLERVQHDDASPYAAPVSQIHFLAGAIREQLITITTSSFHHSEPTDETSVTGKKEARESVADDGLIQLAGSDTEPAAFEQIQIANRCNSADWELRTTAELNSSITRRPPRVLIIDQSPFFRMLLETAIDSAELSVRTLASLDEAEGLLNESEASDIVIWGGVESAGQTDCLTEWRLRRDDSRRPALIGLVNVGADPSATPVEFDHILRRTQVAELLNIVRGKLGEAARAIRKTA